MWQEGAKRTKLALSRFQFNPVGVICNLLSLAQLLLEVEQKQEASECYRRALKEARRMELHMTELMLLHKNRNATFIRVANQDISSQSSTVISKMVAAPE